MSRNLGGQLRSIAEVQAEAAYVHGQLMLDPAKCLTVVESDVLDIRGFPLLGHFLSEVPNGRFPTAPIGYPAREHDDRWHFDAITALHDELVPVLGLYANVAKKKLETGDETEALYASFMARHIDGSLVGNRLMILDALNGSYGWRYQDESLDFLVPAEQRRLIDLHEGHRARVLGIMPVRRQVARAA